jgi:flagellar FliL protein
MTVRVTVLCGLLAAVVATASPISGQPQPVGKGEPDAAARLRELETRLDRLEKRLAAAEAARPEEVLFGDVVVNLKEDRMNRYLRVRIAVKPADGARQEVADAVARRKVELKTWLIGHLADQTLADVSGGRNFNRLREVVRDEFARRLFPGRQPNPIREVLFDEYVVQ